MTVKKKGNYLDCYSCSAHSLLYDHHGRVKGHWCVRRCGRLRKRFRGDCQFIKESEVNE